MRSRDPLTDLQPLIREVYGYVAYRVGRDDADDVTSEIFERAVRYRESYDGSKGTPIAWLIGIARRVLNNGMPPPPFPIEVAADIVEHSDLEVETVNRLTLEEAVGCLPERDRELIGLRFGADLSARQIGALLDVSPGTVDVAIHRALARLRGTLERP